MYTLTKLNIFIDGGPLFMTLIFICLLLSIFFIAQGFIILKRTNKITLKQLQLAIDISLLGLVLGFLGSIFGLITAFDSVEVMGNPQPEIFAAGLKVSLITAGSGLFTFLIGRIGITLLKHYTTIRTIDDFNE